MQNEHFLFTKKSIKRVILAFDKNINHIKFPSQLPQLV